MNRLFLPWSPSINTHFPIGKFTLSLLWMLSGASMEEGRVLGGRAQKKPPKPKNHPNHVAWFWVQPHACNSFGFSGISASLSKGERIRVKLTNINLIVADLHVKAHLYNTAGWWSYTVWSGPDTKYFFISQGLSSLQCDFMLCIIPRW